MDVKTSGWKCEEENGICIVLGCFLPNNILILKRRVVSLHGEPGRQHLSWVMETSIATGAANWPHVSREGHEVATAVSLPNRHHLNPTSRKRPRSNSAEESVCTFPKHQETRRKPEDLFRSTETGPLNATGDCGTNLDREKHCYQEDYRTIDRIRIRNVD